jgi:hypothetical protein
VLGRHADELPQAASNEAAVRIETLQSVTGLKIPK